MRTLTRIGLVITFIAICVLILVYFDVSVANRHIRTSTSVNNKEILQSMNSKKRLQEMVIKQDYLSKQTFNQKKTIIASDYVKEENYSNIFTNNDSDAYQQPIANVRPTSKYSFQNYNISINNMTYPDQLLVHLDQFTSLTPWLSKEDLQKMAIMSTANISNTFHIESHSKLRGLIFDVNGIKKISSRNECGLLNCGILKRAEDLKEVFAFHLDRMLNINRTPAAIATKRKSSGLVRPVFSWISDILHYKGPNSFQPDQNSFSFTYAEYLKELYNICNSVYSNYQYTDTLLEKNQTKKCNSPVKHIEWAKLAIFDFLLQIYDRLDRNYCGVHVSEGEEHLDELYSQIDCNDPNKEHLVHIFTRKDDRSRLIFIDNNAHFGRSENHLNFRLLQGIQEVPENLINTLKSEDFKKNLIKSLQIDSIFWNASGGKEKLEKVIGIIIRRTQVLLTYIENKSSIKVVPDY